MRIKSIMKAVAFSAMAFLPIEMLAWEGMDMPELHVQGRDLVDTHGNKVVLHGFAQTYSPWFNEMGTKWSDYDVSACLKYNKGIINKIMAAGWDVNFMRLHMDPYWSNTPGKPTQGEADISAFDMSRFCTYLDKVFIPMAEYAISKGLYVVMRPPGVCPENIAVGDAYQQYLIKVWTYVAQHQKLKNHPNIMFELANEPVHILGTDGKYGGGGDACNQAITQYFQPIVDAMRAQGCHNVLWVPGLGYQSSYSGFAKYPIKGSNIGYAVHIYPGWFGSNSANGYKDFKAGWDKDIKPCANFAPIMVTEMDWAPAEYNASWGKGVTGDESYGFGANFMRLCEESGNASWLLFTSPDFLAKFVDTPATPGNQNFLNDPEACPWPVYHRFKQYREEHQYPYPDYTRTFSSQSTIGNTFRNPVIYGDFPDVDVIRVGDTYYMLSTTMFYFPGATIMRSYDLVNWEYCANPIENIELNDAYNLNGDNRYSRGMWASSLQYKDGKFYLLFNTLDRGSYLMTATDPEGTWTKKHLNDSFYDCGILFDGDKTYVVHGNTEIWVSQVDDDFNVIKKQKVFTGPSNNAIEGSRMYHIGDYYYIYSTYAGWPGKQTCLRSKDIWGPYEEKELFADSRAIHQGALVQTEKGNWWTILHRDLWPWGRVPYLLPVSFIGGWPNIAFMMPDIDYIAMPDIVTQHFTPRLETNDVFRQLKLGKQWQWNHNPDQSKWSLSERDGFLRMYTASVTNDIYKARNTLTQRMLGCHDDLEHSYGTVCMDISNMQDGDRAGLVTMQDAMAYVGVKYENGEKRLFYSTASLTGKIAATEKTSNVIYGDKLYLRGVASFQSPGTIEFYYSTDNNTYKKFGETWTMQYDLSVFVGNRWGIFNYATKQLGGYVDIDWFSTEPKFSEDMYTSAEFEGYSRDALTVKSLSVGADEIVLMTGASMSISLTATYADGHTENVSGVAEYTVDNEKIVSVSRGNMQGLADGITTMTATYRDPLGNTISLSVPVECTSFPLVDGLFNPSIWESGTFDQETRTVTTGEFGFAGWHYDNGLDLSDYRYIVAKVAKTPQAGGLSFRLFDENSYWSGAAMVEKNTSQTDYDYFAAKLRSLVKEKDDEMVTLDPSHIYFVGFWTLGHQPFVIKEIYVTNKSNFLEHSGINDVLYDADAAVNVYTIDGILLHENVTRDQAVKMLPSGLYIIGDTKVLIRK